MEKWRAALALHPQRFMHCVDNANENTDGSYLIYKTCIVIMRVNLLGLRRMSVLIRI